MKRTLLIFALTIASAMAFAQLGSTPQWTNVLNNSPESFRTRLVTSTERNVTVNVQVPGFYMTDVLTPRGMAKVVTLPKSVNAVNAGEPDMPTLGIPVLIGDRARMAVRIVDAQYNDYEGVEIAPFKGNFSRQVDPADVPYSYASCYTEDAFFPAQRADLNDPYIIRDFRGQNIVVYPFAYNPVTKTLRVFYDMTVEMYKVDDNGANAFETRRSNTIKMDPDFKSVYQRHFINYEAAMNRYTAVAEEGDLLIICYDSFISSMTDFVNWKKTRGINTTIVGTSTAGSTYSAIKTYIQNQYNANNNLTHVLLVGDVAQIPGYTYSGGGSSYSGKGDNAYGQIVGSDIYNDVFVGRFSASTAARVATQCSRVITYERDLTTSASWLQVGEGISRKEGGSGHNSEDDYQHIDNIRTDLLNYGYSTVYQRYANLTGYTATSSQISSDINNGVGIINYANHGQETAWGANYSGYVYYANSHVNALTNDNKLPFIFSVACLVGKYDYSSGDCFAEAWMNATNGSNPTGAIGALMSYISQPWIPPMWAQDECIDILVESYSSNIKHTLGGVSVNGLMGIFDHYSTSETSAVGTYQAWIVYGDPSLMLRTKTPTAMTVTHNGSIDASATSYVVNVTNGNGALATITNANHDILGSATVSNNKATITLTAPGANSGDLTLCVFGYNKVTYLGTITVGGGSSTTYYTISATASPTAGGTVSGAGSYADGATCTLTATPATGYEFTKWTKNGTQVSTNASYSFTVSGDATYVATFTKKSFAITASASPTAGGTVSGAGTYEYGSTVTLTATANSGYTFSQWTKNGTQVSTNASYSFTATAAAAYVAVFTEQGSSGGGTTSDVTIGSGTSTNAYLPTYTYYNYSLTEQIYTAAEIGQAGTITAVSFKVSNSMSTTRSLDVYMKHTTATAFTSKTGWETLSSTYKVFSGNVTFSASGWTTITLDTPFEYNGSNNLLIGVDDNTGSYVSSSSNSPKFYVYSTSANRALRIYSDGTNYNPASPSSYSGTYVTSNNQVMLSMNGTGGDTPTVNTYTITATANPTAGGTVTGAGTYDEGTTVTLTATANSGYAFTKWTKNGTQVSTNASYSFTATADAAYVAVFTEQGTSGGGASDVTIGSGTSTNAYLPTYAYYKYSLTEQIYTAAEIGQAGTITAISFKVSNAKSTTRTLAVYMKHTTKTAFTSKKGWEAVSSSYLVYSGSVTFSASGWTTITLDTPFEYDGTNNLLLAVDDNTGTYVSSSSNCPKFYVYSTGANRALRIYSDYTNYNPASPSSYSGTYVTSNNQVMLSMNGRNVLGDDSNVDSESKTIVIYPNPVEKGSMFTIELPNDMTVARVEVFNTQGACVYQGQGNGDIEMSSDKMTSGLYIVRMSDSEGHVYYGKLVVR